MEKQVFSDFMEKVGGVSNALESELGSLMEPVYLQDFQGQYERAKENVDEILSAERLLRVGIVGQVKAGKSSFLNALVFGGEDVLPRAATPMTAALTRIVYDEAARAKIVFYSRADWELVENYARSYEEEYARLYRQEWEQKKNLLRAREKKSFFHKSDEAALNRRADMELARDGDLLKRRIRKKIKPQLIAYHEIVEMQKQGAVAPDEVLGTEKEIVLADIKADLEKYVGAKGEYTPFVKYIELGIANPLLEGLEIIDTPGLGDPIVSRSEKTKEFLMKCDLVFLLSTSSQFLNEDDIRLMRNTLPANSIQTALLVGSKFDLAMLDDSARGRTPLAAVYKRTRRKLEAAARENLAALSRGGAAEENPAIERIRAALPPKFISSICYSAAKKYEKKMPLDKEEEHALQQMEQRFEGMQRTPEFLFGLANIGKIRQEEFDKIHAAKQATITERGENFVKTQRIAFLKSLDEMQAEASRRMQILETEDADILAQKLEASRNALESMRREIRAVFEDCGNEAYAYLAKSANEIKKDSKRFMDMEIRSDTEVTHRTEKSGGLIFGLIGGKIEHWDDVENYEYTTLDVVIRNIDDYINAAEGKIIDILALSMDLNKVKNDVRSIVRQGFDKSGMDFDEGDVREPVDAVLKRLLVPEFSYGERKNYTEQITEALPKKTAMAIFFGKEGDASDAARIKGEAIHALALQQINIMREVAEGFAQKLEKHAAQIRETLAEQAVSFTDDIKSRIEGRSRKLQEQMQEKEKTLEAFRVFLQKLEMHKMSLREKGAGKDA